MEKTIVVVGATGAQGGGLARAILDDAASDFRVRALTRNPNSDKARELRGRGAEIVQADLDDPGSVKSAFAGAFGAWCVTNFWEHFSPEKEIAQAHNMAEAAKEQGLHHVIWSTLEDTRQWVPLDDDRMPTLMGNYKVPHFDAKGEANEAFTGRGLPVTLLLTSFYWDNLIYFGSGPVRGPDGVLALSFPMGDRKLPGIAVEDIGKCAYGIFRKGREYIGQTTGIAGEHLSGSEMARSLGKALGETVRYHDVPPEDYRQLGFPGAEDLGNMFQFKRDFNDYFCGVRKTEVARSLNPSLLTFDRWLARYHDRIPLGDAADTPSGGT
ncbi:MAG: NmrA/HSCARG family protein [Woeseia sp.]